MVFTTSIGDEAILTEMNSISAVIACAMDIEGLQPMPARITMAMQIEFDENKADVKPQYRDEIAKAAKFLKANPNVTAIAEGYIGNLQAQPLPWKFLRSVRRMWSTTS